jgi:anaerobic ribonucleoside-triphosphate reductase activating protein
MRLYSTYISIHEVPGEVALVLNISECQNNCKGCHSPELLGREGTPLSFNILHNEINKYIDLITCICFMGGDTFTSELSAYLDYIHRLGYKTCLYTGKEYYSILLNDLLDYVKLGPYIEDLGGLDSAITNQVFLRLSDGANLNHLFRSNA